MRIGRIRTRELFIPYFTAYPKHYFYDAKTRRKRLKQISVSESASKNESNKKEIIK